MSLSVMNGKGLKGYLLLMHLINLCLLETRAQAAFRLTQHLIGPGRPGSWLLSVSAEDDSEAQNPLSSILSAVEFTPSAFHFRSKKQEQNQIYEVT